MGEKYDGIRACWIPNASRLYSRHGRVLKLKELFYSSLPYCMLDGELWMGRKGLCSLLSQLHMKNVIMGDDVSRQWPFLRYLVFDVPSVPSTSVVFERRYSEGLLATPINHPFIIACLRLLCMTNNHMKHYTNSVLLNKGEGAIFRNPFSYYEQGKSVNLLKAKGMIDAEACVVDIENSRYICKLPSGSMITATKVNKLFVKIGDVVRFTVRSNKKFQKDAVHKILSVRHDLIWSDVVTDYFK